MYQFLDNLEVHLNWFYTWGGLFFTLKVAMSKKEMLSSSKNSMMKGLV